MHSKRISVIVTLALALLVALVGVASAKSSKEDEVDIENASVPWTLQGGTDIYAYQCPGIPAGLVISSDEFGSSREKKGKVKDLHKNNGTRITLNDTVKGKASDQYGGSYNYLYKNKATFTYDGAGVVHVSMVDSFRMKGGDVNYVVNFNWRWEYEANGIELEKIYDGPTLVNLEVSPFYFGTDDGFTENPNVIPGSWKQIHTNGFIWGCDPI